MAGSGGSVKTGCRFCIGAFGRSLASVTVKTFPHVIQLTQIYHKFCTFNAICEVITAANCITTQHKKIESYASRSNIKQLFSKSEFKYPPVM
jgi:hypothetical protein